MLRRLENEGEVFLFEMIKIWIVNVEPIPSHTGESPVDKDWSQISVTQYESKPEN